jgi:hypothetical protein
LGCSSSCRRYSYMCSIREVIDPQALVGLTITQALKLLHENKCSFRYTYQERCSTRLRTNLTDSYNLLISNDNVVLKAFIG